MNGVNGKIVVSVVIIMAAGAYDLLVIRKGSPGNLTRLIVGGYILAIVASVIDLVSSAGAAISGLLLVLAVTTALYAVIPDLFARINKRK